MRVAFSVRELQLKKVMNVGCLVFVFFFRIFIRFLSITTEIPSFEVLNFIYAWYRITCSARKMLYRRFSRKKGQDTQFSTTVTWYVFAYPSHLQESNRKVVFFPYFPHRPILRKQAYSKHHIKVGPVCTAPFRVFLSAYTLLAKYIVINSDLYQNSGNNL